MDDTVTKVYEGQNEFFSAIFPSTSNPKNIKNAIFKYGNSYSSNLIKCGNKINTKDLIRFNGYYSVIRVYKDIFLAYDRSTWSWVLLRIIVP